MHFVFDLDNTLIDTNGLRPHRKTANGRDYVARHPHLVPSRDIDKNLAALVHALAKHNMASVWTNSPEGYARALLHKHGFPQIPVHGSLAKPSGPSIEHLVQRRDLIIIGDSPSDILTAHRLQVPSVAVHWGEFNEDKLEQAEPTFLVDDYNEMRTVLMKCVKSEVEYKARKNPKEYKLFNPREIDPEMHMISIGSYYPHLSGQRMDDFSARLLTLKSAKDHSWERLKTETDDYFYNGVNTGRAFWPIINAFYNEVLREVDGLNLCGSTWFLAAPNSLPEFSYLTDVMHNLTYSANKREGENRKGRILHRVFPKKAAHDGGRREREVHLETIGIKRNHEYPHNIIVLDDITTTGSQLRTLGEILRVDGFNGNLYGLALGKTD